MRRPTTADSNQATIVPSEAPSIQEEQYEMKQSPTKISGDRNSADSENGVNVERAEAQFHELSRRLTNKSSTFRKETDPEKAEGEDDFDLLEYMKSSAHRYLILSQFRH